jgi:tetratricopeptide (TPR) repeat protein
VLEETEGPESGPEGVGTGVDPAALALALAGAGREEANAFLRKQGALIDDQRDHLHEQRHLLLSRLRLGQFSDRIKATLQVMTVMVGAAIVIGLGAAVWNASRADGMVVEAFSVPPQYVESGITGEVVANDLTDKIGAIRDIGQSRSFNDAQNVRKDSAEEIKVEIPEIGVSVGQIQRYLRLWLGHERHLTGNLRLLGEGKIALSVTLDGERAVAVSGASGDLDKMEQQVAERIFAGVEPINFVIYLAVENRGPESLAAAERATQLAADPVEWADAYSLWSSATFASTGDAPLAIARARIATAIDARVMTGHIMVMRLAAETGHSQDVWREAQQLGGLKDADQPKEQQGRGSASMLAEGAWFRETVLGSFSQAASLAECPRCTAGARLMIQAEFAARAHDSAAGRALVAQAAALDAKQATAVDERFGNNIHHVHYYLAVDTANWPAAIAGARAYAESLRSDPAINPGTKALRLRVRVAPMLAYALAMGGDAAAAQAEIDPTPGDCYDCTRTRGLVAAAAKQRGRADYWFARAVQQAPSIPFAYADWGQSLLARGKPDEAIAQFQLANKKGPHFADPLKGWGEALMAKNQSHLALAKFAEAEKYARNWGRLHLKWGEALVYVGKKDEAKAQFARAVQLDLTQSEKAELAQRP